MHDVTEVFVDRIQLVHHSHFLALHQEFSRFANGNATWRTRLIAIFIERNVKGFCFQVSWRTNSELSYIVKTIVTINGGAGRRLIRLSTKYTMVITA